MQTTKQEILSELLKHKISFKEINEAQKVFDAPNNEAGICLEENAINGLLKISEYFLDNFVKEHTPDEIITRLSATFELFFLSGIVAEKWRQGERK